MCVWTAGSHLKYFLYSLLAISYCEYWRFTFMNIMEEVLPMIGNFATVIGFVTLFVQFIFKKLNIMSPPVLEIYYSQ